MNGTLELADCKVYPTTLKWKSYILGLIAIWSQKIEVKKKKSSFPVDEHFEKKRKF